MSLLRYIGICIFWVWVDSSAQTNNFWYQGGEYAYSFDKTGKLIYQYGLPFGYTSFNRFSISDFNGKPLLHSDGEKVFDSKKNVIGNGDNLKCGTGIWDSEYMLSLDTTSYLIYGSNSFNELGVLTFSYITRDKSHPTGFSIPANRKNYSTYQFDSIKCMSACRNSNAQPVLVIRTKDYFFSVRVEIGGFLTKLDSLYYPERKLIPDSFKNNPYLNINGNVQSTIHLSNNGDFISFTDMHGGTVKSTSITYYLFNSRSVMSFDKQTGKFGIPKIINSHLWHRFINPTKDYLVYDRQCFSPNDSFLYFYDVAYDPITDVSTNEYIYQYAVNGSSLPIQIFSNKTNNANLRHNPMSLNHLGELFFFTFVGPTDLSRYCNKIVNPNSPYPACNVRLKIETTPKNFNICQFNTNHLYDYIRINSKISYDCGAKVNFVNKSQSSIGFKDYKWILIDDKGKEEIQNTFEPSIYYTKDGDYPFKVFAYSDRGKGYGEWFIDTIHVRIPQRPVADFYAEDSIVCSYTGLKFLNYCTSKDTIENKYLWSFGDGNTSSEKNPLHTYTKPGTYSVSLFYRNGYCDSTLTKSQYIKVVDAPKPGFSVLSKQGCAPFTANFTDTVAINVKSKEYYFSDDKNWQNISNESFTHTFNSAGVYKAIQRLVGFSGCIIQTDSVIFNVSKGLTKTDTLNIINSSVENRNAQIYWHKQNGAVKYQLFKDGSPYIQLKDTFFIEANPYSKDVSYTITGIDSCGNLASTGRQGKPIFLQGNLIGNNEASIIYFSPYQQWKGADIQYTIQKLNGGNWVAINNNKTNTPFTDNNFLNRGELQVCYRIEAFESNQPSIISHSNELCIPYIPVIFIPSAFTPNGDSINDIFDVTGFGIAHYNITVYNRWGEILFIGDDKQGWDGKNASDGVYLVKIEYTTNAGIKLNQRTNITLFR